MNCTYCGEELELTDSYGTLDYINNGNTDGKRGDIYVCPNAEGFEDLELARIHKEEYNVDEDTPLEEVACESCIFGGNFHTDRHENLYEGYPC